MTADERAEAELSIKHLELDLKRKTYDLEFEKFMYVRARALPDRLAAAATRAASALMLANATTIVVSLASYRNLVDVLPKTTIATMVNLLGSGLIAGAIAFSLALFAAVGGGDFDLKRASQPGWWILAFFASCLLSFGFFGLAIYLALKALAAG